MHVSALRSKPSKATPAPPVGRVSSITDLVQEHFDFVWRSLRRMGLNPSDADDAAQQVFMVLNKKLSSITPGKERAFLYGTAQRIAFRVRRTHQRRREESDATLDTAAEPTFARGLEDLLDQRRAAQIMDQILGDMPEELRDVFVLYEIEQFTMTEISATLNIASGTVASRLRRAREKFQAAAARLSGRNAASVNPPAREP